MTGIVVVGKRGGAALASRGDAHVGGFVDERVPASAAVGPFVAVQLVGRARGRVAHEQVDVAVAVVVAPGNGKGRVGLPHVHRGGRVSEHPAARVFVEVRCPRPTFLGPDVHVLSGIGKSSLWHRCEYRNTGSVYKKLCSAWCFFLSAKL